MALYQTFTFSTIAIFLSDLATFATANGWTVVSQSSTSVTISKAGTEFKVDYYSTAAIKLYATPGGGVINPSSPLIDGLTVGKSYMFVSCTASLYIGRLSNGGVWNWGGLVNIVNKIGAWTGGVGVSGLTVDTLFFCASSFTYSTFYIHGAWSYMGGITTAGAVVGSIGNDADLLDKQPFIYNAGIMPAQAAYFVLHTTTTLWRPIGFAEGVYRFRAGNIYVNGDIITIGSDTYLAMPLGDSVLSGTASRDLLFKLGA